MRNKLANLSHLAGKNIWQTANYCLSLCIIGASIYFYVPIAPQLLHIRDSHADTQTDIQKIYGNCHSLQDWHECYKKELALLTKSKGLVYAQNVLYSIQTMDSNPRNCHVIAHYMAREAYKRDPKKWLDLADQADINSCGGGFLHGILEAHIGDSPGQEINADFATQVCDRSPDSFKQRMCYHLFGHFFLVDKDGKIADALPLCQQITAMYQYDCNDGLFMEDHQKLALSEHSIAPLPIYTKAYLDSLEKQYAQFSGTQGNACWTEIAEIVAKVYGYTDPQKIYQECYKAKNPDDQTACYLKGVVILSIYVGYDTPEKLLSICSNYAQDKNQYWRCNSYIISSLMHYSVTYADRAITLCNTLDSSMTQGCFQELGRQLKPLAPLADRKQLCESVSSAYKAVCINE